MSKNIGEESFPELNIPLLKIHADEWVKRFFETPIKRITLYSISFSLESDLADSLESYKPNPAIYAVIFDVDEEEHTHNMTIDKIMKYDLQGITGQRPKESYERLYYVTQPNLRTSDFKNLPRLYLELVKASFKRVYKQSPRHNYLEEWRFYVKFKNQELNPYLISIGWPHVVLWEQDQPTQQFVRRIRTNELHEVIWKVYLALKKKYSREATSGEVWLELKREVERYCRGELRKYDKEDIIQEIKEGEIRWINCEGKKDILKKSSFKTTLSRLKKRKKFSKNSN